MAGDSKNRTITGSIKALFGSAAKAITREDEDEQPARRGDKEGERDSGMMQLVRRFARALTGMKPKSAPAAEGDAGEDFRAGRAITARAARGFAMSADDLAACGAAAEAFEQLAQVDADYGSDFSHDAVAPPCDSFTLDL